MRPTRAQRVHAARIKLGYALGKLDAEMQKGRLQGRKSYRHLLVNNIIKRANILHALGVDVWAEKRRQALGTR